MRRHLVVFGLSITSSWGNGHATTFRGLLREFARRGHRVTFVERDVPWYASNRDLPQPDFCEVVLYRDVSELTPDLVADADFVIVGSYVPFGVHVGDWALHHAPCPIAFYDIDTPVTLAKLARLDYEYLHPRQIPKYSVYFSFAGGPTLTLLQAEFGSPRALPLYCSVDADLYRPSGAEPDLDLGYMGTYSDDRQPGLERLLLEPARYWREGRFAVAGPQYPSEIAWPPNCERIEHLPPREHPAFYGRQRFTLNLTRADMIRAGWSPSVRLFEAAACGTPILSDIWPGIDDFFRPDIEIGLVRSADDVLKALQDPANDRRREMGEAARRRVLAQHTGAHRAEELERAIEGALHAMPLHLL